MLNETDKIVGLLKGEVRMTVTYFTTYSVPLCLFLIKAYHSWSCSFLTLEYRGTGMIVVMKKKRKKKEAKTAKLKSCNNRIHKTSP